MKVGVDTPDFFDIENDLAEDFTVGEEVWAIGHPRGCRFSDCAHASEPGCAVRGRVPADRLEAWRRLRAEQARLGKAAHEAHREQRAFGRAVKRILRDKRDRRG